MSSVVSSVVMVRCAVTAGVTTLFASAFACPQTIAFRQHAVVSLPPTVAAPAMLDTTSRDAVTLSWTSTSIVTLLAVLCLFSSMIFATAEAAYCDGVATISTESLYDEPPCDRTKEISPTFNTSINYEGVQIGNLSFCCTANYTALLPIGTNVAALDAEAAFLYGLAQKFLSTYDCTNFYPFRTCNICLDAYRTWICALMFPMKCLGTRPVALQICNDVCLEVQRKCPSEMHFFCPLDDNVNDNGDGKYSPWGGVSDVTLFGRGGCNPMHYNLGPGSQYGGAVPQRLWYATVSSFTAIVMWSLL